MPATKRKPKASSGSSTDSSVPTQQSSKPSLAGLPESFASAPTKLLHLLSTLDKSKVYIIHIDGHPVEVKRQIFKLAFFVNLTILAVVAWRAAYAIPRYAELLGGTFGIADYDDPTVQFSTTAWKEMLSTLAKRGGMVLFDYFMMQLAWTWPYQFFLEMHRGKWANPAMWRWKAGFKPREVVVRRSRNWGVDKLLAPKGKNETWAGSGARREKSSDTTGATATAPDNAQVFEKRIRPAVRLEYLTSKTGYLMLGPEYDLDYGAMVKAAGMIERKELTWLDIGAKVAIWLESANPGETGQWMVWDCHRSGESMPRFSEQTLTMISDKLKAQKKEKLFEEWLELVEREGSKPGPFTEQRQLEMSLQSVSLFQTYDLDFYEFMGEIAEEVGQSKSTGAEPSASQSPSAETLPDPTSSMPPQPSLD